MRVTEIIFFFKQLKTASIEKKLFFCFRASNDLEQIVKGLQKIHFLSGFSYTKDKLKIKVFLRYDLKGYCVFQELRTVSSIGKRLVIKAQQIRIFLNDYPYSTALIRTSKGILNIQECNKRRIGGEFLVYFK